jgi:hypothetical protein
MYYINKTDNARKAVNEFSNFLKRTDVRDEMIFILSHDEIDALLKEGLIEPEPPRGWFSRIFGRGHQYRVPQGYPNIIIHKRAMVK